MKADPADTGRIDPRVLLARGLLLFWSLWMSVVFATNLTDALRQVDALPESWRFMSANYSMIQEAVGIYAFTRPLAAALFGAVVLVELVGAALFWRAFADRRAVMVPGHPKTAQAFAVALGLFAGFLVADEFFIVYERMPGLETTHLLVLCSLLLSLLVIVVLAGREGAG